MNHPEADKHTFLLDDFREVIGMGLLATGTKDVNSKSSSAVGKAQAKVLKLKPRLRGFTSVNTQMADGTSWLTHMWSGTVYQALLARSIRSCSSTRSNKEGIPVGSDTMVAFKNAPHPQHRTLFLDYMLRPENSSANVKVIGYPMMTTAGLKTYGGLTKKYPWLKVTTERGRERPAVQAAGSEDPAALEHRLVEDPARKAGITRCGAASGRHSSYRRACWLVALYLVPLGHHRRGLVRLGRLPRGG